MNGAVNRLLLPLALVMRGLVALRNKGFDAGILTTTRAAVPVISVGNLSVGGTGKTPLVIWLAEVLAESGRTIGVVSRGYGRKSSGVVVVSDGRTVLCGPDLGGDEPLMMAGRFPHAVVVVGERRVEAVAEAIGLGAEVILLDDAFQHRYIVRDLDILVVDGSKDLTAERLLPAGRLREPVSSAARADVIAVSNAGDDFGPEVYPGRPVVRFRYEPGRLRKGADGTDLLTPPAGPVLAFSGIAGHEGFLSTLRKAGIRVGAGIEFPDHHRYTERDLATVRQRMTREDLTVAVTTEKDIVRLRGDKGRFGRFLAEAGVLYLPVRVLFTEGESLLRSMVAGTFLNTHFQSHSQKLK